MKRALVTGANGGIGGAVVDLLCTRGWEVIASDRPPQTDVVTASDPPPGLTRIDADLTDPAARAQLVDALTDHPCLDAVIATHGVPGPGTVTELSPDRARRIMTINFESVWRLAELARPALAVGGGGAFVAIASQAGLRAEPGLSAYCASKAALIGWLRAAAGEYRNVGITLHTLCPGLVDTELLRSAFREVAAQSGVSYDEYLAGRLAAIPQGEITPPAVVAAGVTLMLDAGRAAPTVLCAAAGETLA